MLDKARLYEQQRLPEKKQIIADQKSRVTGAEKPAETVLAEQARRTEHKARLEIKGTSNHPLRARVGDAAHEQNRSIVMHVDLPKGSTQ